MPVTFGDGIRGSPNVGQPFPVNIGGEPQRCRCSKIPSMQCREKCDVCDFHNCTTHALCQSEQLFSFFDHPSSGWLFGFRMSLWFAGWPGPTLFSGLLRAFSGLFFPKGPGGSTKFPGLHRVSFWAGPVSNGKKHLFSSDKINTNLPISRAGSCHSVTDQLCPIVEVVDTSQIQSHVELNCSF